MPPILPCHMQTPAEVQKAAIYCTEGFIEHVKKTNITAKGLALHVTCMNELVKRLYELERPPEVCGCPYNSCNCGPETAIDALKETLKAK